MNSNLKGIKKFAFFEIEKPESLENQEPLKYSLNDIIPITLRIYDKYYYLAGKLKDDKNPFKIVKIHPSGKIIKEYIPFTDCIIDFDIIKSEGNPNFVIIGTDLRNEKDKSTAKAEIKGNHELNKIIVNPSPNSIPSIKIFELSSQNDTEKNETDNEKKDEDEIFKQKNIIYLLYKKDNLSDFYKGDNLSGLTEAYNPLLDISYFSVSPSMNVVTISSKEYILEIKLDTSNKKDKNKIFFSNSPDKKIITNIKYGILNNESVLYICTTSNIYYKLFGEAKLNLIEHSGANPQNFDIDSRNNILISTTEPNCIEEYHFNNTAKNYEKGITKAFEIKTRFMQFFKDYYVFALYEENQPTLCIYDQKNNIFETFDKSFNQKDILFIVSTSDRIYILFSSQKSKNIICLKECEDKKKFDVFYKEENSFYDLAYLYGKNIKYDKDQLAEIAKAHAEYLYKKGDFEKSIEKYKLTINYLDPTYVIQKFLDDSKKNYLILYLEELQKNGEFRRKCRPERFKDFTTILFNCYIKQKQIDKLKNFFEQQNIKDEVTIKAAIDLCKEINNIELVLLFSERVKKESMHELYIQILIDIPKEYKDYIKITKIIPVYINNIKDIIMRNKILIHLGKKLIEKKEIINEIDKTITRLVDDIINIKIKKPDDEKLLILKYDKIISIYSGEEYEERLDKLLTKIMDEDVDCPDQIITKRIELYLEIYKKKERKKKNSGKEYANMIRDIIDKNLKKIDKNYLLMLFKLSGFVEGVAQLSKIMGLEQDLLQLYMEKKDFKNINQACKESMNQKNVKEKKVNYWLQALNFYLSISNQSNVKKINQYIVEVLDALSKQEEFSPINLLDILQKAINDENKVIEVSSIRKFFKDWIEQKIHSLKEDQIETEENYKKIEDYDKNIKEVRMSAKTSKDSRCSSCKGSFEMPFVFFICGHGYHQSCLDEFECSICKSRNGQILNKIENGEKLAKEPQKYKEELDNEKEGNKFDIFANYLGKGVFVVNDNVEEEKKVEE